MKAVPEERTRIDLSKEMSSARKARPRKKELRRFVFVFVVIFVFSSVAIAPFREARPASTSTSRLNLFFLAPSKPPNNNTSVDSRKIKNPTLRSFFDGAIDLGSDAAGTAEKFWETLSK